MKAIVFSELGGPEVLTLKEVPKPEVKPGTVLVQNKAIGVNFADVLFRRGRYTVRPQLPDTPGLEAAGIVEAVGEGVTHLQPGARVAGSGTKTYAEYSRFGAAQVIPLPESVSFEQGAAFPIQVLTAYHLLHTVGGTGPGKSVLVHSAAGGVGLAALQIAKAAGARVFGTVSSDDKTELARKHGADTIINYAKTDFAEAVMTATEGRGVDLVLDAVGKPTVPAGLRCLATFGQLVVYGAAAGRPDPVDPFSLFPKSAALSAFTLAVMGQRPDKAREGIERSFALMREGKLEIVIGKTFPLAQAAEAHRLMESRESVGKLLLVP